MTSQKSRIDWQNVLKISIQEAEQYYKQNGIQPTLRGLFYILVSKNVIPNTKSAYNTLSKVLAEYRYNGGKVFLRDVTRPSSYLEREEKEGRELSENEIKQIIENYIKNASEFSINVWSDQPKKVMIILEKEAQYDLIKKVVEEVFPFGIYKLVCTRGFDSATDIISLAKEINKIAKEGKKPIVLILSDFDPSGEEIYNDFVSRLKKLTSVDFESEKIAVTKEQIFKYNLPYAPESEEEIKKLKRDTRYDKFVQQHGLMRVELDALISLKLEEFKQIIKQSIEKHFDYNIYNNITVKKIEEAKQRSEEIAKINLSKLNKLFSN